MNNSEPVDRVEVLVLIDSKTDSLSSVPVYATLEWKNLMKAVNVLHSARSAFPAVSLHAVAGGFHLSGSNEDIIRETVADFAQFDLDCVIPGHCTGWRAVNEFERAFGTRVVPMAVGMSFVL